MYHKNKEPYKIKEGAIFVADSHYPHHGDAFLQLLQKIDTGSIKPSQLFLMGDNFDLLFGYNDYIKSFVTEAIVLLQKLSETMEIHYFEGNHDFCLKEIFTNINIYRREDQPCYFELDGKIVGISHGDKYTTGIMYNLYCKALRNKTTLTLLRPWQKSIIDNKMKKLSQKKICRYFENFEKHVEQILIHYQDTDMVIEGHFHQARVIGKYISLPSLACQNKVGVAHNGQILFKYL